jgi:tyrosine-protein phosphatase SIW14
VVNKSFFADGSLGKIGGRFGKQGREARDMRNWLPTLAGVVVVVGLIVGPSVLASRQQSAMRNFRIVRDGVLYRSGQLSLDGLKTALHDHGIRTIISLRDGTRGPDRAEEEFCKREGYNFVRIPPRHWIGESENDAVPVEEGVRLFRQTLADPRNHPVLLHCFAGIHRTGAYTAVYRMEFEGWTPTQAIEEMRACGYTAIDEETDVRGYMEGYRPVSNLRLGR